MPSVGLDRAQFDSVSDSGDLIFKHNGSTFTVSVDDVLEHAILEARQIKAESLKAQEPQPPVALPISQIQSAIRAGTDPARVVQRFGVSPALVRRFSAPVETEKQYAIDQFLSVNASKAYQSGNIAGVISDSLAQMGIDMTSVSWKATRRGLEPWRIVAQFDAAGRQIRAQWSWNMHDNTVEALNPAARRLLDESEQVSATRTGESDGWTHGNPTSSKSSPNVHRDAGANGRAEQHGARVGTVQAKAGRAVKHRDAADASTQLTDKPSSDPPKSISVSQTSGNHSTDTSDMPSQHRSRRAQRHAVTLGKDDGSEQHGQTHGDRKRGDDTGKLDETSGVSSSGGVNLNDSGSQADGKDTGTYGEPAERRTSVTGRQTRTSHPAANGNRTPRRKNGRSAVPSWDEIIFGE